MRITNSEAADSALTEAALFLESQRNGQGFKFLEEFSSLLNNIKDHPEMGRKIGGDLRRAILLKHKYVVHYR